MARFCPLFSSSSGNCIYIGNNNTHILIDCGVSAKKVVDALSNINVSPDDISAVFITHEHSDHISGLHAFCSKRNIKIYASCGTCEALKSLAKVSNGLDIICIEDKIELPDITVERFKTSHDCADSSGYKFSLSGEHNFAICTDTGCITRDLLKKIKGCDLVLLESNHDVGMLQKGPYTPSMKKRILSDEGHLSNGSCAQVLPELVDSGTTYIVLGHMSQKNNLPEVAESVAEAELIKHGHERNQDYILYIAPPSGGKLISL